MFSPRLKAVALVALSVGLIHCASEEDAAPAPGVAAQAAEQAATPAASGEVPAASAPAPAAPVAPAAVTPVDDAPTHDGEPPPNDETEPPPGEEEPAPPPPAPSGTTTTTPPPPAPPTSTSAPAWIAALPTKTAGCGKTAATSAATGDARSVTVGGKVRTFVEYVPAGYDKNKAYPVVVVLHGAGSNGTKMSSYIAMQKYTAGGAIVVFPDAVSGQWDISGDSDLLFFDALVADTKNRLCTNAQKVFVEGFSRGGYMTNFLGCRRSSVIRGIAPAAGGFSQQGCSNRVAAFVYHRADDDVVKVADGRAARDRWRTTNGCSTSTRATGSLGCVEYTGCTSGTPLVWCEDTGASKYKHDLRDVYRTPIWNWMNAF